MSAVLLLHCVVDLFLSRRATILNFDIGIDEFPFTHG